MNYVEPLIAYPKKPGTKGLIPLDLQKVLSGWTESDHRLPNGRMNYEMYTWLAGSGKRGRFFQWDDEQQLCMSKIWQI